MDCCKTKDEEECCKDLKNSGKTNDMKGGEKMDKKITLWIVIGVLFVVALLLTFKAGASGNVAALQSAGSVASSASSGMVGGC